MHTALNGPFITAQFPLLPMALHRADVDSVNKSVERLLSRNPFVTAILRVYITTFPEPREEGKSKFCSCDKFKDTRPYFMTLRVTQPQTEMSTRSRINNVCGEESAARA
jgi:hypothetical protein